MWLWQEVQALPRCDLRLAETQDQDNLDALIFRSKAHWGYDAEMMAIMKRVLKVSQDALRDQRVMLGIIDQDIAGVVQIEQVDPKRCELDLLFIDPAFMGQGVGKALYDWSVNWTRTAGCRELTILSDPYAQPFYEAMGADFIEMRPSDAVPGRELPWLVHTLI